MSFDEGNRVELVSTSDPFTSLEPGDRGTVTGTDTVPAEIGPGTGPQTQVWVEWDDGQRLAMVLGEDSIRTVEEAA